MPLASYAQNLKDILAHPTVAAHSPRLILVTPPPVNEYQLEVSDQAKGYVEAGRTAKTTRSYAIACQKAGEDAGVPVLDLWSAMMAKTGWKASTPQCLRFLLQCVSSKPERLWRARTGRFVIFNRNAN